MIGLRHVLAPPPRWLTPRHVALAAVAAITAVATPPIAIGVPASAMRMEGHASALLFVVAVTTGLSLALARCALRAASTLHARIWLAFGGVAAGALAVMVSDAGVMMIRDTGPFWSPHGWIHTLEGAVAAGVVGGGPLGFLFGTAYAQIVTAAMRAEQAPSHDGIDRVVLAAGAVLLAAVAACTQIAPSAGAAPWAGLAAAGLAAAGGAGALAMGAAGVRMIQRVRLLARVRDGDEPGFHVVPRSGRDDEAPLLPLVRSRSAPEGVLAATGVSAPYRGARGIFKLALAPLPDGPVHRPLAELGWAALSLVANSVLTLAVGGLALVVLSPILVVVALVV
jgi:hypothetical protein